MICVFRDPLTMKILSLGRPLYEAERIAAVLTIWAVLLCAMMGFSFAIDRVPQQDRNDRSRPAGRPAPGTGIAGMRGILPGSAGTMGIRARTLLMR